MHRNAAVQVILNTTSDSSCCQSDLSGYKILSTTLRLMIEQDSVYSKHTICFSVFLHDPEAILFCYCIRAVRMERSGLTLRNLLNFSVKLRSGCLIDLRFLGKTGDSDSLQDS